MALPDDAATWDVFRTQAEIAVRMPAGWTFDFDQTPQGYWRFAFLNETGTVQWEASLAAPNLVVFDALGWLDLRTSKQSETSPWVRRRELTFRAVQHRAPSNVLKGLPDLDPGEIEAVYSRHRKR